MSSNTQTVGPELRDNTFVAFKYTWLFPVLKLAAHCELCCLRQMEYEKLYCAAKLKHLSSTKCPLPFITYKAAAFDELQANVREFNKSQLLMQHCGGEGVVVYESDTEEVRLPTSSSLKELRRSLRCNREIKHDWNVKGNYN